MKQGEGANGAKPRHGQSAAHSQLLTINVNPTHYPSPWNLGSSRLQIATPTPTAGVLPTPNTRPLASGSGRPASIPWLPGGEGPTVKHPRSQDDHWETVQNLVERYDDDMCKAWKDEIDKLLMTAGLFSATITAFAVETFKWLDDPREDDETVALLRDFMQSRSDRTTAKSSSGTPFAPTAAAIRINLWIFLSLGLSLSTVLVGILCLQWLREYQRTFETSSREALALRQIRFAGLVAWHVPDIISILPVALQLAMTFFFIGMLELLWARNSTIAIIVLCPIGIAFLVLISTTVLPGAQQLYCHWLQRRHPSTTPPPPQCAYKSPQARLFQNLLRYLFSMFHAVWRRYAPASTSSATPSVSVDADARSWTRFDSKWRQKRNTRNNTPDWDLSRCFQWARRHLCQSAQGLHAIHECFSDLDLETQKAAVLGAQAHGEYKGMFAMLNGDDVPLEYIGSREELKHHRQSELARLLFLQLYRSGGLPDPSLTLPIFLGHYFRISNSFPGRIDGLFPADGGPESLVDMISEVQDVHQKHSFIEQLVLHASNWTEYNNQNPEDVHQMSDILFEVLDQLNNDLPEDASLLWPLFSRFQKRLKSDLPQTDRKLLKACAGVISTWIVSINDWQAVQATISVSGAPENIMHIAGPLPSLKAVVTGCAYAFCAGSSTPESQRSADREIVTQRYNILLEAGVEELWKEFLRSPDLTDILPAHKCWFWGDLPEECRVILQPQPVDIGPLTGKRQRIAKPRPSVDPRTPRRQLTQITIGSMTGRLPLLSGRSSLTDASYIIPSPTSLSNASASIARSPPSISIPSSPRSHTRRNSQSLPSGAPSIQKSPVGIERIDEDDISVHVEMDPGGDQTPTSPTDVGSDYKLQAFGGGLAVPGSHQGGQLPQLLQPQSQSQLREHEDATCSNTLHFPVSFARPRMSLSSKRSVIDATTRVRMLSQPQKVDLSASA